METENENQVGQGSAWSNSSSPKKLEGYNSKFTAKQLEKLDNEYVELMIDDANLTHKDACLKAGFPEDTAYRNATRLVETKWAVAAIKEGRAKMLIPTNPDQVKKELLNVLWPMFNADIGKIYKWDKTSLVARKSNFDTHCVKSVKKVTAKNGEESVVVETYNKLEVVDRITKLLGLGKEVIESRNLDLMLSAELGDIKDINNDGINRAITNKITKRIGTNNPPPN